MDAERIALYCALNAMKIEPGPHGYNYDEAAAGVFLAQQMGVPLGYTFYAYDMMHQFSEGLADDLAGLALDIERGETEHLPFKLDEDIQECAEIVGELLEAPPVIQKRLEDNLEKEDWSRSLVIAYMMRDRGGDTPDTRAQIASRNLRIYETIDTAMVRLDAFDAFLQYPEPEELLAHISPDDEIPSP
jgi:hypothetical protein